MFTVLDHRARRAACAQAAHAVDRRIDKKDPSGGMGPVKTMPVAEVIKRMLQIDKLATQDANNYANRQYKGFYNE